MKIEHRKNLIFISIFVSVFIFLFWKILYEMVMDWYLDPNYSHGFLIPLISGYILLQIKDNFKSLNVQPSNTGLLILMAGLSIFLIGKLSGEYFTMRLSMLIVLAGSILFVYGTGIFKEIAFPFFYLIYMIPLPYILYDSVAFPLKLFVSKVSVGFLSMIGILVIREGNIIHLVDTTLEVADACSGIRSIVSLLALSTALAYFTQKGWKKRLVLIVLAVPIAVLVNAVRVIGTGILADKYGAEVAQGFFHEFAGLMIFGIAIVSIILSAVVIAKIKKKDHE